MNIRHSRGFQAVKADTWWCKDCPTDFKYRGECDCTWSWNGLGGKYVSGVNWEKIIQQVSDHQTKYIRTKVHTEKGVFMKCPCI